MNQLNECTVAAADISSLCCGAVVDAAPEPLGVAEGDPDVADHAGMVMERVDAMLERQVGEGREWAVD